MFHNGNVLGLIARIGDFNGLPDRVPESFSDPSYSIRRDKALKPHEMVGFMFRYHARKKASQLPRVYTSVSVWTPEGLPAIEINA